METTPAASEEFMKAEDVAKRLDVTVQSVYRWARDGKVKSVRIGGIVRFRSDDIEKLLRPENAA